MKNYSVFIDYIDETTGRVIDRDSYECLALTDAARLIDDCYWSPEPITITLHCAGNPIWFIDGVTDTQKVYSPENELVKSYGYAIEKGRLSC